MKPEPNLRAGTVQLSKDHSREDSSNAAALFVGVLSEDALSRAVRIPARVADAKMAFQFPQHLQGLDNRYGEADDVFLVASCD
jgi:hypothetical protein